MEENNMNNLAAMLASREEIETVSRHEGTIVALTSILNNAKKCGEWISRDSLVGGLEGCIADCYGRMESTGDYGKEMALALRECLAEEEEK